MEAAKTSCDEMERLLQHGHIIMAITNYAFDRYVIYHNTADNSFGQTAVINCYQGVTHRGTLYFYRDGFAPPASEKIVSGALYLRFHERRFSEIVETLRQETPLNLSFNDVNKWGSVYTGEELVGEQEL